MPQPYPNPFASIPRSVGSLKFYFAVHDQPLTRGLLHLVRVALLITLLGVAVALTGYMREAQAMEKDLAAKLSVVRLADGKALSEAKQPCLLWKSGSVVVVLDTTGRMDTLEKAEEFAGCAQSHRLILFGTEKIESFERGASEKEGAKHETLSYADDKKLAELRQLIESSGAKMPEPRVENGLACFSLPPGKVHIVLHTAKLMVLVDTSGKKRSLREALNSEADRDPAFIEHFVPPEFLVLISGSSARMKPRFERDATELGFAGKAALTPVGLARWITATARQARTTATLRGLLPNVLVTALILFVLALAFSVAGLIVGGFLHSGLAYGELLTMAIYATTPAAFVFSVGALALRGQAAGWLVPVSLAVGILYAALATRRTAQQLKQEIAPIVQGR